MSLDLPDHFRLPTSPGKHNLAVAQVAIYSIIIPVHFVIRSIQTWKYWSSKKWKRNIRRCLLRGFYNFINIVGMIRIIGNSLYLAIEVPSKSTAITIIVLQGVAVIPLFLSWVFLLLRCGRVEPGDSGQTLYPRSVKLILQWARLPLVVALVLIIVSAFTLILAAYKAGAVVFIATLASILCVAAYIMTPQVRHKLTERGQKALLAAAAIVPFLIVRVTYVLLIEFGSLKYSPILGDWHYQAGMGLAMEVVIMLLLITGRVIIQPVEFRKDARNMFMGTDETKPAAESGKEQV